MKAEDHRISKPTKKDPFNDEYVRTDIRSDFVLLGSYKTRERALQVLDEIHSKQEDIYFTELKAKAGLMDWDGFTKTESNVYQMPES